MGGQSLLAGAVELHRAGKLDEAERDYRKVLDQRPNDADALNLLSVLQRQRGNMEPAVEFARRATQIRPEAADYHLNLGEALRSLKRYSEAIVAYERSLQLRSGDVEVWHALGVAQALSGLHREAIESFNRAITLRWNFAAALEDLAGSLATLGEFEEAIKQCRRAITLYPNRAAAHLKYGAVMHAMKDYKVALAAYAHTAKLDRACSAAHLGAAQVLNRLGNRPAAEAASRAALALEPNSYEALNHLGMALAAQSKLTQAVEAFEQSISLAPTAPEACGNLAGVMLQCRDHGRGIELYRKAAELAPQSASDHSNLLLAMNYCDDVDPQTLFDEHRHWAELHAGRVAPINPPSVRQTHGRRIRVGYVSPDFRQHPVSYFIEPILAPHDRERFEVIAYSDVDRPDATTARLREHVEHWKDVASLSDLQLARLVRSDEIDILVDLSGHTAGNRLPMFAIRPAPVQMTYLGYPNTTGLRSDLMNYRITDQQSDPAGLSDSIHTEQLLRLEDTFLCYRPALDLTAVTAPPSCATGFLTFGSFSSMQKVTRATVCLWAAVLRRVPHSRLIIKNKAAADPTVQARLRCEFEDCDVSGDRLVLLPASSSHNEHLAQYDKIDIALDTFAYHGTTTTCEALWMGVPVVTLSGNAHRSRVGISLLHAVGLPDLVSNSAEDFAATVVALASDSDRLRSLRRAMRERMTGSPLMDEPTFVAELESRYQQILTGNGVIAP